MSIEYRAMLKYKTVFQSGATLAAGTIIYVEETPSGWIAKHHDNPKSAGGMVFEVDDDDFSIFEGADDLCPEVVVVPEPEPDEEARERLALAHRRLANRIRRMREKADELEGLLTDTPAIPLVPGKE